MTDHDPRHSGPQPPPEPALFIIFGSRGDLSRRKLLPALFNLLRDGALPRDFAVLGLGRKPFTPEQFQQDVHHDLEQHSRRPPLRNAWARFSKRLRYFQGVFEEAGTYIALKRTIDEMERRHRTGGNRVIYLAVPPDVAPMLLRHLRDAGIISEPHATPWTRVIFEKPFGEDLASARELNRLIAHTLDESQVYRIDHYLAKETVQNIHVFRFANTLFESAWNHREIDHVQITMAEQLGIGTRGAFYDEVGVVRDVLQNHLLQLLSLIAMETPSAFTAEAIRDEKTRVLRAVRGLSPDEVPRHAVRGQYDGYRREPHVAPDSATPTFAALRLFIDNARWQGVPFYLRTGKKLATRLTEIVIQFRDVSSCLFNDPEVCRQLAPNALVLRIQPNEAITLTVMVKAPGMRPDVHPVEMDFCYHCKYGTAFEAYERLLINVLQGDQTLFVRSDAVETQWQIVEPLLRYWDTHPPTDFPNYAPASWGPQAADELIQRDGRRWKKE